MEYMDSRERTSFGKTTGKGNSGVLAHKVMLSGRNQGIITGVLEVIEFDNNVVDLDTSLGRLQIKGRDLKVKGLNLDKGEVEIEGNVDNLLYTTKQSNESFVKRLFK